jgi:zinc protease
MAARRYFVRCPAARTPRAIYPDAFEDRMRPLRTISVAALATLATISQTAVPAAARAQSLPSAKELMDKNDAAIGGRKVLDQHSSYHQAGTMSVAAMGMEAQLELFKAKPAKYLQKIQLGGMGEVSQGFDGKTAWSVQPGQPPMVLDSATTESLRSMFDFYGNFHDMSRYKSTETIGLVDFEGRKCYKVKIVKLNGNEGFEFYDATTGLIAGLQAQVETPMGKIDQTSVFSDYKDFSGLMVPTKVQQKNGQFDAIITFTAMEFDKVDPAVFELPEAVKAKVKP